MVEQDNEARISDSEQALIGTVLEGTVQGVHLPSCVYVDLGLSHPAYLDDFCREVGDPISVELVCFDPQQGRFLRKPPHKIRAAEKFGWVSTEDP